MPVHKRTYRSRKVVWFYEFNLPGATRQDRTRVSGSGFATKKEATDAETARQLEEQRKRDLAKAGASVAAAPPKTLSMLLAEFISQHAEEKLAPKTIERYREQVTYLHSELVQMPLAEITPLHLSREWNRMLKSGGHTRRDKTPRPMSAKTVRNIAGVVSSAFGRAIKWGLTTRNPVSDSEPPVPKKHYGIALTPEQQDLLIRSATSPYSEPPVPKKHYGIALTPEQQDLLIRSATSPWCLPMLLEMSAATGARRGEVLALRWSDNRNASHSHRKKNSWMEGI